MKIKMITVDPDNLRGSMDEVKLKVTALGSIINPVLDKFKLSENDKLEVCQIGKLMMALDYDVKIIDKPKPPSPDFILEGNNGLIGLEHTRIFNKNHKKRILSIKSLFDAAAIEFIRRHPEKKIMATFRLEKDELKISKKTQPFLIDHICELTINKIAGNDIVSSDFIREIRVRPNRIVSFSFLEKKISGDPLPREVLENAIKIKEGKLMQHYRSVNVLKEYWLALFIGSLSSASYELDSSIDYTMESSFDQVFLIEDFKGTILRIK